VKNRETQIGLVAASILPRELAAALRTDGVIVGKEKPRTLREACGITENTQRVLCRMSSDIQALNVLETLDVRISWISRYGDTVRRNSRIADRIIAWRAECRAPKSRLTGTFHAASPRSAEDELGYSVIVHLVVAKILQAKFHRQILIISHNANVPVLGDADHVIRMENRPRPEGGRQCVVAAQGTFEERVITDALMDLEGGPQAFSSGSTGTAWSRRQRCNGVAAESTCVDGSDGSLGPTFEWINAVG